VSTHAGVGQGGVDQVWVDAVAAAEAAPALTQAQADQLAVALVPWLSEFRRQLAKSALDIESADQRRAA
jgi:hypothetical protein